MREKSRPNVASLEPGGFLEDGRSEEQLTKNLWFKLLAITKLRGNDGGTILLNLLFRVSVIWKSLAWTWQSGIYDFKMILKGMFLMATNLIVAAINYASAKSAGTAPEAGDDLTGSSTYFV